MNKQAGRRLVLAGFCFLGVAPAASAQDPRWAPPGRDRGPFLPEVIIPDNSPHPSHRPLDSSLGDLTGAEDALSRRLRHTQNLEALKALVKDGLDDAAIRQIVKAKLNEKLKDAKPEDVEKQIDAVRDMIKKNPDMLDDPSLRNLLDDPKLQDLLNDFKDLKQNGGGLSKDKQEELANLAKGFIEDKIKRPPDADPLQGTTGGGPTDPDRPTTPMPPTPQPVAPPGPKPPPSFPPAESKPSWISRDMIDGFAGLVKDIDKSSDGESLRTALREFAKMDLGSPGSSSDLSGFFKEILSSDEAGWLAHNLKGSSAPNLDGWPAGPSLSAGPTVAGASSGGMLDGLLWAAILALLGAAAWMVWTMARRQAAAARARPWSPGPWPVHPSQVSTREDLIRAFEHLAYLLLGRAARSLNHLDVASRLAEKDFGRHGAAERLGRLYEQARYAPPQEPLPADELAAARGDLSALAGAAA